MFLLLMYQNPYHLITDFQYKLYRFGANKLDIIKNFNYLSVTNRNTKKRGYIVLIKIIH